MKQKALRNCTAFLLMAAVLTGCASSSTQTPDDYATNEGYTSTEEAGSATTSGEANVSRNDIKEVSSISPILRREEAIPTHTTLVSRECRRISV